MSSTSVSSIKKSFKFDVFLSFRGEDTRKTFVDHLYHALHHRGITTYKDDERMEKGERIDDQLMRSIEDSRFYIIVLSKNYASSSWCLDELVKILECQKMKEHKAYPIFYDVEPTEVRNQSGLVGKAFSKHVEKDVAGKWRDALNEAANLAGWELRNTDDGHESKFIQKIVEYMSLELRFISPSFDEKLVGMETRVQSVVSSLEIGCNDVRMMGIKGIGGGGKTTLARAIFDHISVRFESKSFVENVREVLKGSTYNLKKLQNQILKDVINDKSINVTSVFDGKHMMKQKICASRVLVVLDDVDGIEQLEALAGEPNWFGTGSRIIITTRDEQVLLAHQVNIIHDVNLLSHEEAICLFSRYAFGRDIPLQGYEELSEKVVHYAAGLPLTIKVLGSSLCGKIEREWDDALERLKTIPLKETLQKLELSYNGLENDQKDIFLDVACILKGKDKKTAIKMLESCGFHAEVGLRVLEQKSLITLSNANELLLHDHIEEMGRNLVRRLHPNKPNSHSRLWVKEEIEDILVNELGTKATRSIKLQNSNLDPDIMMKGLRKMKKLRFLYVDNGRSGCKINEIGKYLPNTLQCLHWTRYPYWSLPKTFQADNLVDLEMAESNISQLWEVGEVKVLNTLRFLKLTNSMLRTFDLRMTPNLEKLNLGGCDEFEELYIPVKCPKLESLYLNGSKVRNLNLGLIPNLERLNLDGCTDFIELHMPIKCPKLKFLDLGSTKVSNFNLGLTQNLEDLNLAGCNDLVELHMHVECPKLNFLNLNISKVSNFNLGLAPNLEMLYIAGCNDFVELHMPVECPKLIFLNLSGSKVSYLNLGMTPNLEMLYLEECSDFVELHMPIECPKLNFLSLSGSKVSNLNLGMSPYLKTLYLERCNDFVELHMPIECPELNFINLSGSKVANLNLGMTPHLKKLDLSDCYYLQEIYVPNGCLEMLVHLNLSGCSRFKRFSYCKSYGSVSIFESIEHLVCPLHPHNNLPKLQFTCRYDVHPALSSRNLGKLISFGPCACTNLESFSARICSLQHLRVLILEGSIPEVPKDLGKLECLEQLILRIKEIKHLPDSICMLKHLTSLDLSSCWLLELLPMDLGRLECLEYLHLRDCISLRDIPNSICKMKCLKCLWLNFCILVEKLPDEFGNLECLKALFLVGAGVSRLPQSIFKLKGLKIYGSRWRLESYGFTSLSEISTYEACYDM